MIQSYLNEKKDTYPCIKRSKKTNLVVLFNGAESGTVIVADEHGEYTVGYFSEGWNDYTFAPTNGKVVLCNA